MTTTVQSLLKSAQTALSDLTGITWPATELATYLNDGQRQLVIVRPDAGATTASFVPAAGARQVLPAGAVVLMDIPRNTAGTKKAIRKVDQAMLDAFNPDWQSMTGVTEIIHFSYDPREPNVFMLYPPAAGAGASVELIYSAMPADVATPGGAAYSTATGNISVADQWAEALLNYVLARAYAKDGETLNAQLSQTYMGTFAALIGVQLTSSQVVAPKE